MKRCPFCAEEIQDAAVVCRFCNRSLSADIPSVAPAPSVRQQTWSPGVAAVLSFVIPGLGQIYKGQIARGLIFLPITIVGYAMLILPGVILHIVVIFDAYNSPTIPHPGTSSQRAPVELTPEQRERQKALNRKSLVQMLWIAIGLAAVVLLSVVFARAPRSYRLPTTTPVERAESAEWEAKLKAMVTSSGHPCVASVSAFHQGSDSTGNYWNLRCTDSFTYSIQLVAGQPAKVLQCEQFKRTTGIACFNVLRQKPR